MTRCLPACARASTHTPTLADLGHAPRRARLPSQRRRRRRGSRARDPELHQATIYRTLDDARRRTGSCSAPTLAPTAATTSSLRPSTPPPRLHAVRRGGSRARRRCRGRGRTARISDRLHLHPGADPGRAMRRLLHALIALTSCGRPDCRSHFAAGGVVSTVRPSSRNLRRRRPGASSCRRSRRRRRRSRGSGGRRRGCRGRRRPRGVIPCSSTSQAIMLRTAVRAPSSGRRRSPSSRSTAPVIAIGCGDAEAGPGIVRSRT